MFSADSPEFMTYVPFQVQVVYSALSGCSFSPYRHSILRNAVFTEDMQFMIKHFGGLILVIQLVCDWASKETINDRLTP
jgi:hypothetical protein